MQTVPDNSPPPSSTLHFHGPAGLAVALFAAPSSTPAFLGLESFLAYAVFLLVAVGSWWAYRARKKRQLTVARIEELTQEVNRSATKGTPSQEPALRLGMDSGLIRAAEPSPSTAPEQVFFPKDDALPQRRCPKCERSFPGVFDLCPYDTTPLEQAGSPRKSKHGERLLPRRFCPECERRFNSAAEYCYVDGITLSRDYEEAAAAGATYLVCRTCGLETKKKGRKQSLHCPHDGEPLEVLDPAEQDLVIPTIPFNSCRKCGHLGAPGQTLCPVDGNLMLPELSARLTALPSTGYGPRRKLCTTCGTQFAGHCQYCSFDGSELISLN